MSSLCSQVSLQRIGVAADGCQRGHAPPRERAGRPPRSVRARAAACDQARADQDAAARPAERAQLGLAFVDGQAEQDGEQRVDGQDDLRAQDRLRVG